MHERITLIDRRANHILYTLALEPWLTISKVVKCISSSWRNVVVSSHEWIENTQLIELNEQIIIWDTVESWHVTTSKYDT